VPCPQRTAGPPVHCPLPVSPSSKGETLRDRIDSEGELPVNETVRIVAPSTRIFACSVNETSTDLWWVTGVAF
jgi:hypothetical protein